MRDIKSRAWNAEMERMFFAPSNDWSVSIHDTGVMVLMWCSDGIVDEIPTDSLMRFTGLQDSKGGDIYEGDVLQSYHFTDSTGEDNYINHIIKWSDRFNGWFALNSEAVSEDDGSIQLFTYKRANKYSMKIIGNIHENPELLGG